LNWEIIENSDLLCMNDIYMTRVLSVITKILHTFNQTCMRGWRSLLVQWKNLHVSTNWVTTTCICLTRSLSVTKSPNHRIHAQHLQTSIHVHLLAVLINSTTVWRILFLRLGIRQHSSDFNTWIHRFCFEQRRNTQQLFFFLDE
jgi:hypothetical protein